MESNVGDFIVGLMMAVFGLIGLFLERRGRPEDRQRAGRLAVRLRPLRDLGVAVIMLGIAVITGATRARNRDRS